MPRSSALERVSSIVRAMGTRRQDYILQRAITPQTYRSKPFMLRVLVHQRNGQPMVIGSQARIGYRGSFMAGSGIARRTESVLSESLGLDGARLDDKIREIHNACVQAFRHTAGQLQKTYGHPVTELGFDVVLDRQGTPFVIEANSRPQILQKEPILNAAMVSHVVDTAEAVAHARKS